MEVDYLLKKTKTKFLKSLKFVPKQYLNWRYEFILKPADGT